MYQDTEAMAGVPFAAGELSEQLPVTQSWSQFQVLEIMCTGDGLREPLKKSTEMGEGMS